MPEWWNERLYPDCQQSLLVREVLYDKQSAFQHIQVLDTLRFGRALALDGIVQTTEADEFIYHEMLVHPAMVRHANPLRAVLIGGGDGGAAREILRWSNLERLDLIEIDPDVIDASKRFLPTVSRGAFEDSRLVIKLQDGSKFIESSRAAYDLVVIDSSDPLGPAQSLFSGDFYAACAQSLRTDGVLVAQCGAPFLASDQLRSAFSALASSFRHVAVYLSAVPTYTAGASRSCLPRIAAAFARSPSKIDCRPLCLTGHTRHYSHALDESLFALPKWLASALEGLRPSCETCGF
jgi:spermidine synthase